MNSPSIPTFHFPLSLNKFTISATTPKHQTKTKTQTQTQTQTQTLNFNSYLKNKTTLIPIQKKSKTIQHLSEKLKHGKIQTITDFNSLLMGLVNENELDFAYKLYSNLPNFDFSPNSLTFSIIVNCHCKRNQPIEAKKVLEHMITNGFDFDCHKVKTFTQVINSFCKKGQLKMAFRVFEMMSEVKCEPNINTYNCLLKGLCYVGRVEDAYEMLLNIKKCCWKKADIYSYTAVMDGFCKVGRTDEALELLHEAIEVGLSPSIVTYNTIFNGYFKEGRPMEGFGLLERMKEHECDPDYVSYSTLLHGLLQWGEINAGVKVYYEMVDLEFRVDERMTNTLLRGVCRRARKEKELLKDAYYMFDEMCKRGCDIDPCAFELMIEAYCNGNEMDKAFVNLCEMINTGLSPKTFTLNIVVKGLCVEGKIENAMSLLVLVCRGRSEMLDRLAFDVLINEMNRLDMVRDATCVYCFALKNGVIPLRKPRR